MVKDHSDTERGNPLPPPGLLFPINSKGFFYIHHPTDRIAHTTAFVTPVVDNWLEREIRNNKFLPYAYALSAPYRCPPRTLTPQVQPENIHNKKNSIKGTTTFEPRARVSGKGFLRGPKQVPGTWYITRVVRKDWNVLFNDALKKYLFNVFLSVNVSLSRLWDGSYKRFLAANSKEMAMKRRFPYFLFVWGFYWGFYCCCVCVCFIVCFVFVCFVLGLGGLFCGWVFLLLFFVCLFVLFFFSFLGVGCGCCCFCLFLFVLFFGVIRTLTILCQTPYTRKIKCVVCVVKNSSFLSSFLPITE